MYTMRPAAFTYHRPESIEEAIGLLEAGEETRPLAGGHSLLPAMKLRLSTPAAVVDLAGIRALTGIERGPDGMVIGAMTTHAEVAGSDEIRAASPVLAETAALIGDPQVRRRGTIGGSVAHADPSADYPTVLVAIDATIETQGPNGRREIPASGLFQGLFTTALEPGELVTAVRVPVRGSGFGAAYEKHKSPRSGYAVVGVAATYGAGKATVVVGGVTGVPVIVGGVGDALSGREPTAEQIAEATSAVGDAVRDGALDDSYASGEYRAHLATVLATRALNRAVERSRA
jgi:carbon-monoxide dehydrogenase medium subunit